MSRLIRVAKWCSALALLATAHSGDSFARGQNLPGGRTQAADTQAYVPLIRRDWSGYSNDSALKAAKLFWVEGNNNKWTERPTTPEDYYELVDDAVFGKVVRYKGGPWANTVKANLVFGAVATHAARFGPLEKVWIRQFVRFGPTWWPVGGRPDKANNSYKLIFIRWEDVGFRQMFGFLGSTQLGHEYGQGPGHPVPGAVKVVYRSRPPDACSFDKYYAPPMYRTQRTKCASQPMPDTRGNGQWYEFVMGHEQLSDMTGRGTFAWRQYTVDGSVRPQAWTIVQVERTHAVGQPPWKPARSYEMGVNRNKTFDEPMYWDWGPYEIVDGAKYSNPFELPIPR